MLRKFTKAFSLLILSVEIGQAQICEEKIQHLQGSWLRSGFSDTALLLVKGQQLEFNFKGAQNWDPPYMLRVANTVPFLPDSVSACGYIQLLNAVDTLYYQIRSLTDSTLHVAKYSIDRLAFDDAFGQPQKQLIRTTQVYKKARGLPAGYNLKATVIGTWYDEATTLVLHTDSTFSIVYSEANYVYSTCGTYTYNGKDFVLKDKRRTAPGKPGIRCHCLTIPKQGQSCSRLKNKPLLFNSKGEIHLHYTWLGLGLKENHRILTKMR